LDCALTYRLKDGHPETVAPVERVRRELTTDEWKQLLTKAWNAGIPHAVFTGGEPTIRPDLSDLIAHTQKLGMVSGLITSGYRLSNPEFLHSILQAGLDHIMLVLDPEDDEGREALRDMLAEDISVAVHITVTKQNIDEINPLIDYLVRLGLRLVSLSTNDRDLSSVLQNLRQVTAEKGLKLVWDLPVPYSQLNPVSMEQENTNDKLEGAGKAWLYVEPDGDVLPGQGIPTVLGNFLSDPWEEIWKSG
jgi:MoaA/NifB/PqqE/SkfB family radical SAM enzyme